MSDAYQEPRSETGTELPDLKTEIPGPGSKAYADRLSRVECAGITFISDSSPVFWDRAAGANVWDVDGNRFVDLTAAFAVASYGHGHPALVRAATDQMEILMHGMGDVHPPRVKVALLEALCRVTPGDLGHAILGQNGADAVEAALKTAYLHTKRARVITFEGGYHGLSGQALEVTGFEKFKTPFAPMLGDRVDVLPFPDSLRPPPGISSENVVEESLAAIRTRLEADGDIGAIILEPVQGRGGIIVPPKGFLQGLRSLCDGEKTLLICDEIMTGFGRTGRWFACEHEGVVPDLLCVGKAVTGGFPFSACLGRPGVMASWPKSTGEAIHTSTYLGHPVSCAVASRAIDLVEELNLPLRANRAGLRVLQRLQRSLSGCGHVAEIRGLGLMVGIDLVDPGSGDPSAGLAGAVAEAALKCGVVVLPCGRFGNVLSLTPPLTIGETQLDTAVELLSSCIRECVG